MTRRRRFLRPTAGMAAVATLVTFGSLTRPAMAHITELTVDPEGTVSTPGGVFVTVSGTLTVYP
jgi:hypothetical protein